MDPMLPRLEREERRRRRRMLFRSKKVPVRMLVPNFFTLLSLCAGLTAIRMAIDSRFEFAVSLIVIAGLLDAMDGRVARMLKAQSKFGAELDSLADFANFGVAPAILMYTWGLAALKGFGWITVLVFALAMGLRLARFNAQMEVEKPHWQSNYFTGIPAPAGAIALMLPVYVHFAGLYDFRAIPQAIAVYSLLLAFFLVSSVPTFSGKLLGEKIEREWVLPIFVAVGLLIALLVQYPFETLTVGTMLYLVLIPLSWRRFTKHMIADRERKSDDLLADDAIAEDKEAVAQAEESHEAVSAQVVDLHKDDHKR